MFTEKFAKIELYNYVQKRAPRIATFKRVNCL